jgi:hypothetical protein
MYKGLALISILSIAFWSCTPKVQTGSSQGAYYEDLSAHRPTYPAVDTVVVVKDNHDAAEHIIPQYDITDTLNAALDSISVLSQEIRYIDGYTVQIYSGSNRESANIASGKASTILADEESDLRAKVSYKSPNFKVQVGRFFNTLDAHTVHAQMLRDFPNAIIVLKKFRINRN